jgi:hypothetical protein
MAHFHSPPATDHLAAVRAQDEDTYWVFVYDLRTRALVGGVSVMTFGGAAEVQSAYAEDDALMPLILDLAAANSNHTIAGGHAPLKPSALKTRHGVTFQVLLDRAVNRTKLPLHAWRNYVDEASAAGSDYAGEEE